MDPKITVKFLENTIDIEIDQAPRITNRMLERMIVLVRRRLRAARFQVLHDEIQMKHLTKAETKAMLM